MFIGLFLNFVYITLCFESSTLKISPKEISDFFLSFINGFCIIFVILVFLFYLKSYNYVTK